MFSEKTHNIEELANIAKKLLNEFKYETVFALHGKMGAGKTTFIQYLCDALGVEDIVTSPTFAIVNEYETKNHKKIYHFDFYRIEDIEEAYDIGYDEYIESGNYCFIEWPEMIDSLLPPNMVTVTIDVNKDHSRTISATIKKN